MHALSVSSGVAPARALREEIGDEEYERYLAALAVERAIGETVAATIVRDGQELTLYIGGGDPSIAPR